MKSVNKHFWLAFIKCNFAACFVSILIIFYGYHKNLDALIGLGAALVSVCFDRFFDWRETEKKRQENISKVEMLVTTELVISALSLIILIKKVDAAIMTMDSQAVSTKDFDFSQWLPKPMMFTDRLGESLLILDKKKIECLCVLKNNLFMLENQIHKKEKVYIICSSVKGSLKDFKECFENFAPERALTEGDRTEKITSILQIYIDEKYNKNNPSPLF